MLLAIRRRRRSPSRPCNCSMRVPSLLDSAGHTTSTRARLYMYWYKGPIFCCLPFPGQGSATPRKPNDAVNPSWPRIPNLTRSGIPREAQSHGLLQRCPACRYCEHHGYRHILCLSNALCHDKGETARRSSTCEVKTGAWRAKSLNGAHRTRTAVPAETPEINRSQPKLC